MLVVDANVLFSFFKQDSSRRKLLIKLLMSGEDLVSPQYCFEELAEDKERINKYSGTDDEQFAKLLSMLEALITSLPESKYSEFEQEAARLAPQPKDAPYFAAAIACNCPIWSDDKAFKKQGKVKVATTSELAEELKES